MYIPPPAPIGGAYLGVTLRESFVCTFSLLKMHQFLASLHLRTANLVRMLRLSCASHRCGSGPVAVQAHFVGKTAAFRSTFFGDFSLFSRICCHSAAVRRLCSALFALLLPDRSKWSPLCGRLVGFFSAKFVFLCCSNDLVTGRWVSVAQMFCQI